MRTPHELIDAADGLLRAGPLGGRRIAVLADGGGHGGIAAVARRGGRARRAAAERRARRRAARRLPPTAAVGNPIDLAGGGEQDVRSFDRTAAALLRSGEVDAVLLTGYFGGYATYGEPLASAELAAGRRARGRRARDRPPGDRAVDARRARRRRALRSGGVPVLEHDRARRRDLRAPGRARRAPRRAACRCCPRRRRRSRTPATPPRARCSPRRGAFADARTVAGPDAAVAAAAELGYPVVLKALGTLHKSDAGGVAVGLARRRARCAAAAADMARRLAPPAFSVERMAPLADGVELLIGARRDARFGPIAVAGLGGLYTEVLADAAVALAPVDEDAAHALLLSLRGAPLLHRRARAPAARPARRGRGALAALSRVAAAHPELAALEINPLLVLPEGALGLDARLEVAP